MRGNSRLASSTGAMPRRTRSAVDSRSIGTPSNSTEPVVGRTTPMMVFIVVDLPLALPPSRRHDLAFADRVVDVLQHVQIAVMGVDVA